jgi:hypothetical protein
VDLARLGRVARVVVRLLQTALVGLLGYAALTVDPGLFTNVAMSLVVAFLPDLLDWRHGHRLRPVLALWIAVAAFLHALGALGPYETVPWYDHVTHTLSATLVAGVGFAVVVAIDREHDGVQIPARLRAVFILLFVLAFGVLWEIAEFASGGLAALVGGEPALAQYGLEDIVLDLVFNTAGAVVVALWGTGYFREVSRLLAERIDHAERSR